jgi:hypothetical protein
MSNLSRGALGSSESIKTEHAIERDDLFEGAADFRLDALNFAPAAHIDNPDRGLDDLLCLR